MEGGCGACVEGKASGVWSYPVDPEGIDVALGDGFYSPCVVVDGRR